ncbi:MAG TPA: LysM domain-containing protein, partial [Polyangia bacterium]
GSSLFDLYYLGLGQRVALTETASIKNVQQAIIALQNTVLPVKDPTRNPLSQLPGLRFNADSNWLIGAQFQLMDTLAMSVVFNDPDLYGLRVALSGERAAIFAGLAFEILYRKVSDDVGVYHLELKLPDAMRQLEFGAVSVTLPVVVIDIYTNGDFRLDFGFPVRRDFSRSFAVQAFPFVGAGGFYFAKLDGNTSERVPRISNGTFAPVIEFGLGLSLGLGKTIDKGILKAGLTLTVEAILEGVVAWFNPSDRAVASERYYFVQGTAALVGQLYGEVDFGIIGASVNVTAYASVTLTVEAHEPIVVKLVIGVSVSASVKILFIRISFSFRLSLDLSFTIGARTAKPWLPAGGAQPAALQRARPRRVEPAAAFLASHAARALALGLARRPVWTPVNVFDGKIHNLLTWVLPGFTVAGTTASDTQVELVLSLFVANNIAAGAHIGPALRTPAVADGLTPFNLLLEALLAWALHSALGRLAGVVSADQLADLLADLARPETAATGFDYSNLSRLLALNVKLWLTSGDGDGGGGSTGDDERNATVFPIAPALAFRSSTGVDRDFAAYNPVDEAYVQCLAAYFRQTQVDVEADVAPDPLADDGDTLAGGAPRAPKRFRASAGAASESFATAIFRDGLLLLTKTAVQCALTLLERYPYAFQTTDTLADVAARYGLTPAAIARANPALGVAPSARIEIAELSWQARAGQ